MKKILTIIIVLLNYSNFFTQERVEDSLWIVWNNESLEDTARVDALKDFIRKELLYSNPDSSYKLADMGLAILNNKKDVKRIEDLTSLKGASLGIRSNYEKALSLFKQNKEFSKLNNYPTGVANNLSGMGFMYASLGNYSMSLDLFFEAIKIYKETKDTEGLTVCYNNLGVLYGIIGNLEQSLVFYNKSLELAVSTNDKSNMMKSYSNIGAIYINKKKYKEAIKYYLSAYDYLIELNDKEMLAIFYENLGLIFIEIGDQNGNLLIKESDFESFFYHKENKKEIPHNYTAEELIDLSLKLNQELGSQIGVGECYVIKGNIAENENDAIFYYESALKIANKVGAYELKKEAIYYLIDKYKIKKDFKKAFKLYELYSELKDSINSDEIQEKLIRQEYKYNYEKQVAIDSLKHKEAQRINEVQLAKQDTELKNTRLQQYLLFGGLGIAALFLIYFIRKNKQIKEQKRQVNIQKERADSQRDLAEEQKDILTHQHREIKDSIQYAHNLQKSVLPSINDVNLNFPNSFILYKPKDVVSGDFYWTHKKGELNYLAVIDCTGHGVPGAFMTIVANNLLNEIVEDDFYTPKSIVEELHQRIKLKVGGHKDAQVRDSMDLGLFSFNKRNNEVLFIGTHTSLSIVRNSKLESIKGSKADIGYKPTIELEEHKITVCKNDMLYMHSDGFPDQKGGPRGKKFYYKPIRDKFEEISLLNLSEQEQILSRTFEGWKGELEQLDDVCVIGVRI